MDDALQCNVESAWLNRPQKAGAVGAQFLQTLEALGKVDALFGDWWTWREVDGSDAQPLEPLLADVPAFVQSREDPDWAPPNPGYLLFVSNGEWRTSPSSSRLMTLILFAGSRFTNYFTLRVTTNVGRLDTAILDFNLYKAMVLAMVSVWRPPWVNVRCSLWGQTPPTLPGEPEFPYTAYQMPWIAYLDADLAKGLAVPADVKTERLADGGVLMIATEEPFDPSNVQHMRPSRFMAQTLSERGGPTC
jgi:hypothetical protein